MYVPYQEYQNYYYALPNLYNYQLMYPTPYTYSNFYRGETRLKDHGREPFVININTATKQNNTFRTALWTGEHLQLTLMSINPGEDIGLEVHPKVDQFLRIEQGRGVAVMGKSKDNLTFTKNVMEDSAIFVPAGIWHNIINTGPMPLKLYSIYAPPNHPFNTVHATKADALSSK